MSLSVYAFDSFNHNKTGAKALVPSGVTLAYSSPLQHFSPSFRMPLLTPHGKQLSIQNLLAISTMMSPFHHHDRTLPNILAGGGHAASGIPEHQFYLSNAIQDHLKTVYQKHCGEELTLSRDALVIFLQGTQAQSIEVPAEPTTYGFEEFLRFLWSNHALDAMRAAAPKDLSRPISNYFISSSHNTYLSGNQLSSKSSTDSYKNVRYLAWGVSNLV